MIRLYEKLCDYGKKDIYPFHMPGHNRNPELMSSWFPFQMDITEITDFDDLHDPADIILEAQNAAARLYGVKEAFYSVNGSTAAILSSVSASVSKGGRILIARNCHRSVYNAACIRNLECGYLYPGIYERCGINGGIRPEDVKQALRDFPGTEAVVITSPTYDGIVSDIRSIADIVHDYGAVLIVDAAHGAHFAFGSVFPEPAEKLGADLVITSIHKTLPSPTQTALLLSCTGRVSREKIRRFLSLYETSSPSYVLMAAMDFCAAEIERRGKEMFRCYEERLLSFRKEFSKCRRFTLLEPRKDVSCGIWDFDRSKLLISTERTSLGGPELHRILHDRFRIECEMAAPDYVLALSSVGDTSEGFGRLLDAMLILDMEEQKKGHGRSLPDKRNLLLPAPVKAMPVGDAEEAETEELLLSDSVGKISGEYAFLYPPGIPLIVPGETVQDEFVRLIPEYQRQGLNLKGFRDREFKKIRVIKEAGE